ncbi:hypothetical protein DMB42_17915 [Nonomuraea sp. WAC 01424]|nr:hypothetical protein DMB42_17915 [Nonomuraea sp. WAC 01424]
MRRVHATCIDGRQQAEGQPRASAIRCMPFRTGRNGCRSRATSGTPEAPRQTSLRWIRDGIAWAAPSRPNSWQTRDVISTAFGEQAG